jgi:hypothetical protein
MGNSRKIEGIASYSLFAISLYPSGYQSDTKVLKFKNNKKKMKKEARQKPRNHAVEITLIFHLSSLFIFHFSLSQ